MKKHLVIASGFVFVLLSVVSSCQNMGTIDFQRYYSTGAVIYQSRCQNCHGMNGEGLGGLIPPLTDSVFLRFNKDRLACYISKGLNSHIAVNGTSYNGQMPPAGLAPIEVAQVLTYIGNSYENRLGLIDIDKVNQSLKTCQ